MSSRARAWSLTHTYRYDDFDPRRLAASCTTPVSVCLPARNEARTIGPILQAVLPLRELGLVHQIVVVDDSIDGTAEVARGLGVEVHAQSSLRPELGPALGKGDAMWRALSVLRGELICFLDADSELLGPHFVYGLLGPLLCDPAIAFVKGTYRRPLRMGGQTFPDGGGRVTELTARPLLERFFGDLAAFGQPLAGEVAARRELLERLPFLTGYGVDIALLIDAYRAVGLDGLAQVDLEVRQNAHQPLRDLGPMAAAVLDAVLSRAEHHDEAHPAGAEPVERPPMATRRAAA